MKSDEAIQALHDAYVDVVVATGAADDESGGAGASADESTWTPRQVLAHIVWWHERYLKVVSAKVDGRARLKLPGKLDDINVLGIEAYGDRSLADLTNALEAKEHALESLVGVLYERPNRTRLRIVTRDESAPIALDAFVNRITEHLHGHARDLRTP